MVCPRQMKRLACSFLRFRFVITWSNCCSRAYYTSVINALALANHIQRTITETCPPYRHVSCIHTSSLSVRPSIHPSLSSSLSLAPSLALRRLPNFLLSHIHTHLGLSSCRTIIVCDGYKISDSCNFRGGKVRRIQVSQLI
jgi:hypothetical protein